MRFRRLRHRLLGVVGAALILGLAATAAYYIHMAEAAIRRDQDRSLHNIAEAVSSSLESIMLGSRAEIAATYVRGLPKVAGVRDFVIVRTDGTEAFVDNATIEAVNERLQKLTFETRAAATAVRRFDPTVPEFKRALAGAEAVSYIDTTASGERLLVFLDPIINGPDCHRCHGNTGSAVRAVIKIAIPYAPLERDITAARERGVLVLGLAVLGTLLTAGYVVGRSVVKPIEGLTAAMERVSKGDLDYTIKVTTDDEIGRMGGSFNAMTRQVREVHGGLRREQDKLNTIIYGAAEAVVVTDAAGLVVLVNPAAEELLGKTRERIAADGFLKLFDEDAIMRRLLDGTGGSATETVIYNDHVLLVSASSIFDEMSRGLGSAALLRDVTQEKRLEEELRRLAVTDGLTGLYNRRHLDETLAREFERSGKTGIALSVLMFDIDHFKRFNDTYGHDQGDRVLQAMAVVMRQALRLYDVPCRYGGEEFVAVLPGTDARGALAVAERMRQDVEAAVVDDLRVTVSVGVACWPDTAALSGQALLEAADAALYASKAGGRNRVSLAPAADGQADLI